MKTNILRYRWQNEQQQQQNSSARAADSAENKSQSCYLEHTSQLLHSISSIDLTLKLHPVVCQGRKIKFSHPQHPFPIPFHLLKNFRASEPRCASTIILVESTTLCLYVVLENNKTAKHPTQNTLTHKHVTLKHQTIQEATTLYARIKSVLRYIHLEER